MQSSGSTLVSWCFLQRRDLDGYLDGENDVLDELPQNFRTPGLWYKTTIKSFRLAELIQHYGEAGWTVRPLLICRDVRHTWASLAKKTYGFNGTTSEDPPLRFRFSRFKADWELFRREGWPLLRYERFLREPESVLRETCAQMGLAWDAGMLTWPKRRDELLNTRNGNRTFHNSCGNGLLASLKSEKPISADSIPPGDLAWLEEKVAEYNKAHHYPLHIGTSVGAGSLAARAVPTFDRTRRQKWLTRQAPMHYVLYKLGLRKPVMGIY
jgi:hypothetical protein